MWQDLAQALPIGSDHASKTKRDELFDSFDVQATGVAFQADVIRGLVRRLPFIPTLPDSKSVLHRGRVLPLCRQIADARPSHGSTGRTRFRATVECVPAIALISVCQLDRNQFRFLLVYLWHYFKFWEQYTTRDSAVGRKATLRDFVGVLPELRQWGCRQVEEWESDPESAFRGMQRGGPMGATGVLFDDLADVCLRSCLQQWNDDDNEEERQHAVQILSRNNPQMVAGKATARRPGFNGIAPAVPPPGQKRPPASLAQAMPTHVTGSMLAGEERWTSNYMGSYMAPRNLAAPKTPSKATQSPSSARDPRQLYAWQRPERVIVRSLSQRATSRNAEDASGVQSPFTGSMGTGRAVLRSQMDRQMDMYSTQQMKNLLAVAGGLTVAR